MSTASPLTEAESTAYVEAIVRRAGTSFYWAMRRLPEQKRQAMYAIYAFCREVDDIADGADGEEQKRAVLGLWRGEIERLYADRPRNSIALALQRPVAVFGLKKEDFRAVIDGMEMDAQPSIRIPDMDELTLYCDRVACAVGRLSVRVFGLDDDTGRALAFAQGQALQLTNILRDIDEDARNDRLYVPNDLLVSLRRSAVTLRVCVCPEKKRAKHRMVSASVTVPDTTRVIFQSIFKVPKKSAFAR